jgi:flagellar hook-length control protein FliK
VTAPQVESPVQQQVPDINEPVASESAQPEAQPVLPTKVAPQDMTVPDQPFEAPVAPKADREEAVSTRPAASRKGTSPTAPAVASAGPSTIEPVATDAAAPIEPIAEAGVRKDVLREQAAEQVAAPDVASAVATNVESTLATGSMSVESAAGNAPSGVAHTSPDAAAASTPAHVSQQVQQALAAYEAELPQGGSRSFELLLDPPELGRLLVQMSRTSKGVDVRIAAENETVRSILETTGAEMQQTLQLSGFDLGQFSGSSSGGNLASGEEWIAAPSLRSFAGAAPGSVRSSTTQPAGTSAVNVVV